MTGRRIVSISLPRFAMERWRRRAERTGDPPPDDAPLALVVEGPHGLIVHAANGVAEAVGIRRQARLADMRALCPELQVDYADPGGDAAALARLALWARRWCPWTVADGADGLILDTTGSDHLRGGEAAMLVEMEARLARAGFSARLAIGPTWGAAWALARYGETVRPVCPRDRIAEELAPLPAQALRLEAEMVLLLQRLGLKTIGSLAAVPRLSLARRFSRAELPRNPLLRLDQAMGRLAEPVASAEALPSLVARCRLAKPVQDPTPYLPVLLDDLCRQLACQGQGARRLRLLVYRTDGEVRSIEAATSSPSRDAGHLVRLFDGKLERIDPGFGFDLIVLEGQVSEPLEGAQTRLDGGVDKAVELSRLIDRLTARLGTRAITRPRPVESHIPERAECWTAAMADLPPAPPVLPPTDRPLRLLDPAEEVRVLYTVPEGPPIQFVWRRQIHRVTRYAGPERIAPEWWHDRPSTRLRDYFRVEVQDGRRFWLYREGLHGDGRGGDPHWLMHGMFA